MLARVLTYALLLELFEDDPDGWLASLPPAGPHDPLRSDDTFVQWLTDETRRNTELVSKARRVIQQFRNDVARYPTE